MKVNLTAVARTVLAAYENGDLEHVNHIGEAVMRNLVDAFHQLDLQESWPVADKPDLVSAGNG